MAEAVADAPPPEEVVVLNTTTPEEVVVSNTPTPKKPRKPRQPKLVAKVAEVVPGSETTAQNLRFVPQAQEAQVPLEFWTGLMQTQKVVMAQRKSDRYNSFRIT